LIDECEKIYGKKMIVVERDHLTVSIRNPSNQRAKQIINWEPKISIGDGIRTLDKFL
jgi:nucleoside-diphosphate-sugar epimerase